MKKLIPDVLTPEDRDDLLKLPAGNRIHTGPVIEKIKAIIELEVGPVLWEPPTYMRLEKRVRSHPWHVDTGTNNHMMWCEYGCSILLEDGTDREVGCIEYRDGTIVRNYLSLAIHDSKEEHRVTDHKRERKTFLCFLKLK